MSEQIPGTNPLDKLNDIIDERVMLEEAYADNAAIDAEAQTAQKAEQEAAQAIAEAEQSRLATENADNKRIDAWVGTKDQRSKMKVETLQKRADSLKDYLDQRPAAQTDDATDAFHVKGFNSDTVDEQHGITGEDKKYAAKLAEIKNMDVRKMRTALEDAKRDGRDFELDDIEGILERKIADSQKLDESKVSDKRFVNLLDALNGQDSRYDNINAAEDLPDEGVQEPVAEIQIDVPEPVAETEPVEEEEPKFELPKTAPKKAPLPPIRRDSSSRMATPTSTMISPDVIPTFTMPTTSTSSPEADDEFEDEFPEPPVRPTRPAPTRIVDEPEAFDESEEDDEDLSEEDKEFWSRLRPDEQDAWEDLTDAQKVKITDRLLDEEDQRNKGSFRKHERGVADRTRRAGKLLGRLTRPEITGEPSDESVDAPKFNPLYPASPTDFFGTQRILAEARNSKEFDNLIDDLGEQSGGYLPDYTNAELDTNIANNAPKVKAGRTLGRAALGGIVAGGRAAANTGRRTNDARRRNR